MKRFSLLLGAALLGLAVSAPAQFADNGWVNVVGGCCGTTPAHIGALAELAAELKPATRHVRTPELRQSADDPRPALAYEPTGAGSDAQETPEELETLRRLGIPYGQGWLFGKPTPLRHDV